MSTPTSVSDTNEFKYTPPDQALIAKRILIKPNLGYPLGPPVTISMKVLSKVIDGLRSDNQNVEILIVEGVCSTKKLQEIAEINGLIPLLTDGITLLDADQLPLKEYPNLSPKPVRFKSMWAPKLLEEVDCCLSISTLKRTESTAPLISATLKNLVGLFPRQKYRAKNFHSRGELHRPSVAEVLQDIYFCIGHFFKGGIVDADQRFVSFDWRPDAGNAYPFGKIIWGNDLLEVDKTACELAAEQVPSYIVEIQKLRKI